jgi:hypothetical protein
METGSPGRGCPSLGRRREFALLSPRILGDGQADLSGKTTSPGDVQAAERDPACESKLGPASLSLRKAWPPRGPPTLSARPLDTFQALFAACYLLNSVFASLCPSL